MQFEVLPLELPHVLMLLPPLDVVPPLAPDVPPLDVVPDVPEPVVLLLHAVATSASDAPTAANPRTKCLFIESLLPP